jgi:hypothetical protein
LVEEEPIHAEFLDGGGESLEIHRLYQVTIHSKLVALENVALLLGRSQDDGGD